MSETNKLNFSADVIIFPLIFVLLMWMVFWAEIRFNWDFNFLGINPRKVTGLPGILLGPFIHSNLKHLFNNSIPLLVLSTSLFYFYRNLRWKVLIYGLLLSGLITWLIGRPAVHIGASGVVYMLAAFLFFKGIFSKPIDPKISWEGHTAGFVVGLTFALIFKKIPIENKKYDWEKEDFNPEEDDFIKQFDENGNFIEKAPEELPDLENQPIRVIYTFKKDVKKSDEGL
jgi:membrane associated rhomboid family serine protease